MITAAILAGAILSTSAITGSAVNESIFLDDRRIDSGTLYIKSDAVPESATTYIRDIFANLYADDLDFLGYSFKEAKEMRLSPGFCATDFETGETLENVYYFPVMCGRNFVGMFTVTFFDGEYGYSFGKSEFADSLNKLKTMPGETAEIIMNEDATYGVVGSKVELLEEAFNADKEREQDVMRAISERALLEFVEKKPDELGIDSAKTPWITDGLDANIVYINAKSLYPEKVDTKEALKTSGNVSFYGKKRMVPLLKNENRPLTEKEIEQHPNKEKGGYCSVCCISSLVGYYIFGEARRAQQKADELYEYFKNIQKAGDIDFANTYIHENTSKNFTKTNVLEWQDIRKWINTKNSPCYTSWKAVNYDSKHAMVLCGYRYNNNDVNASQYYGIFVMDPNKPRDYQSISYNNGNATFPVRVKTGNTLSGETVKYFKWTKTLKET